MTKSQSALNFINEMISKGKTIYIGNSYKSIKVSPKIYANWQSKGIELFKIDNEDNLRIARGKAFDIIVTSTISLVSIKAI